MTTPEQGERATARVECEEHHWVSKHQPGLPIYWVDQCSLCGDFNGERMRECIVKAGWVHTPEQGERETLRALDKLVADLRANDDIDPQYSVDARHIATGVRDLLARSERELADLRARIEALLPPVAPAKYDDKGNYEGREGGPEHRTTGGRAWCYSCSEWCYPESYACPCCEPPIEADDIRAALSPAPTTEGET